MIKPIFTEKSLADAKSGKYNFWVDVRMDKSAIKAEISHIFDVHVSGVKTILRKGEERRNLRGRKFSINSAKKAIVTLKENEKIDIFEQSKKSK